MKQVTNVKRLVMIGLLGALAGILMLFKFPLPFMPPFMEFDLSGLVEVIGGFVLGPGAAVLIILVKLLVKLAFMGTSTMLTGEVSNFLLSCAYAVPAALDLPASQIQKIGRDWNGSGNHSLFHCGGRQQSAADSSILCRADGNEYGRDCRDVQCGQSADEKHPHAGLVGIVPFNLIKYGITSVITRLVYKRVSKTMKRYMN